MMLHRPIECTGFFVQNPGEDSLGGPIPMFLVLSLPSLKFCPGLVACRRPNIFPSDPFALFETNLLDVSIYHRAPICGRALRCFGALLSEGSFCLFCACPDALGLRDCRMERSSRRWSLRASQEEFSAYVSVLTFKRLIFEHFLEFIV